MAYAKVDDLYDDKRKMKRAWRANPASIGLHIMAITYCQRHALDGKIPDDWLAELLPKPAERTKVLKVMLAERLLDHKPHDDGEYRVHDFLDWNDSAAEREQKSIAAPSAGAGRPHKTEGR